LPYIAERFSKEYIFAYYIGESFSALIPGVLALFQGVETNEVCTNQTVLVELDNNGLVQMEFAPKPVRNEPNFSVLIYFMSIFIILCISFFSFVLLDSLPLVKKIYKKQCAFDDEDIKIEENYKQKDLKEKYLLLFYNFLITFFMFGFLPGINQLFLIHMIILH
jgi:hypothetical protein